MWQNGSHHETHLKLVIHRVSLHQKLQLAISNHSLKAVL